MKADNFVVIQGWMITELDLKGNDLIVYAVIHGFSQTEKQKFTGSLQYLADWCNSTKAGIQKNLKNLIDKGLIVKENEVYKGTNKVAYYTTKLYDPIQQSCMPMEQSCTNNINKQKNNKILSKDKNTSKNGNESFLGSVKKEPKQNLYSQCISLIDNFIKTNNCFDIRELLIHHLDLIVEEKKLRGQKQYQGILNKLQQAHEKGSQYNDIINYSIEHGYPTFYEQNSKQGTKKFIESGNQHVESFTEEDEKNLHEFQRKLKKEGKQIYF